MSVLAASGVVRTVGTLRDPWDDLYLTNADGQPVSLREALKGVDRGGGFFRRDAFGQDILFDPEGVSTPSPTLPSGADDYIVAPYVGQDQPGIGSNTLRVGQMRQWTTVTPEGTRTYLVIRTPSGDYRTVEATNWSDA